MTSVEVTTVVMEEIVPRDSRSVLMEDVFTLTGPVRTTVLETRLFNLIPQSLKD